MRFILKLLMGAIVLMGGAVTATAAFRYGWAFGHGDERWIYAFAGLFLDVCKSLLPITLGLFLAGRSGAGTIFRALAGWLIWAGLVVISMQCAMGLYAQGKEASTGDTLGQQALYQQLKEDKTKREGDLAALRTVRTVEIIDAALEPMKRNRLWDRTAQCTSATTGESREFCGKVDALTAERRSARPAKDVQNDIKTVEIALQGIEGKLSGIDMATVMRRADPSTEALVKLTGFSPDFIKNTFATMMALALEMVGLLPWIVHGSHAPARRDEDEPAPIAPPVAVEAPQKPAKAKAEPDPVADAPADPHATPAPEIEIPEVDSLIAQWAKGALVRRKGSYVPADELYSQFSQWCRANGHEEPTKNRFGRMMTSIELKSTSVGGDRRYYGVALIPKAGMPTLRVVGAE